MTGKPGIKVTLSKEVWRMRPGAMRRRTYTVPDTDGKETVQGEFDRNPRFIEGSEIPPELEADKYLDCEIVEAIPEPEPEEEKPDIDFEALLAVAQEEMSGMSEANTDLSEKLSDMTEELSRMAAEKTALETAAAEYETALESGVSAAVEEFRPFVERMYSHHTGNTPRSTYGIDTMVSRVLEALEAGEEEKTGE